MQGVNAASASLPARVVMGLVCGALLGAHGCDKEAPGSKARPRMSGLQSLHEARAPAASASTPSAPAPTGAAPAPEPPQGKQAVVALEPAPADKALGGASSAVEAAPKAQSATAGKARRAEGRSVTPVAVAQQARVSGSLDRKTVQRVIGKNLSGVKWCYQDALARNKNLKGKLKLAFTILPNGSVASPTAINPSIQDQKLLGCITRRMKRWRFPAPKDGGVVKVSYPLSLKTR